MKRLLTYSTTMWKNTFAAYPEEKVTYEFFDMLLGMCQGYPAATARDMDGSIAGFGLLRPISSNADVFADC